MALAVHDEAQLLFGHPSYVGLFGKVLANQAVDLFVQAPLPGPVGFGEVDSNLKLPGDGFMMGEHPAVVGGDDMKLAAVGSQLPGYSLVGFSRLFQNVDLATIIFGELLVLSHKYSL